MTVIGGDANTNVAFKNFTPFTKCETHINDEHLDTAENIDIIMPMYNLIQYSDNYSDTSGSLREFNRDESPMNNNGNPVNVAMNNSSLFKYKSNILGKPTAANNNGKLTNAKIFVPLKYLSNFWKSLETSLIK